MPLATGTTGVLEKDWHVYIADYETGDLQGAIGAYLDSKTEINIETVTNLMGELGELRADSIELGIEKGDTVEGNTLGEIVLNKAGSFTCELINATPGNIAILEALDRANCTIVMIEKDTHDVDGVAHKTVILMNGFAVSYTEKITGSDIIRSTISIARNVPTASAFRNIADVDYSS